MAPSEYRSTRAASFFRYRLTTSRLKSLSKVGRRPTALTTPLDALRTSPLANLTPVATPCSTRISSTLALTKTPPPALVMVGMTVRVSWGGPPRGYQQPSMMCPMTADCMMNEPSRKFSPRSPAKADSTVASCGLSVMSLNTLSAVAPAYLRYWPHSSATHIGWNHLGMPFDCMNMPGSHLTLSTRSIHFVMASRSLGNTRTSSSMTALLPPRMLILGRSPMTTSCEHAAPVPAWPPATSMASTSPWCARYASSSRLSAVVASPCSCHSTGVDGSDTSSRRPPHTSLLAM
mmetsp:Transcript_13190/g.31477  ORF Transcript_13190/g.31477 Transcript_13190/m.31477 type:complete len:290 (-) Transcript_13190:590-1459(-)